MQRQGQDLMLSFQGQGQGLGTAAKHRSPRGLSMSTLVSETRYFVSGNRWFCCRKRQVYNACIHDHWSIHVYLQIFILFQLATTTLCFFVIHALHALCTADLPTPVHGQESSTCWSSTLSRRRRRHLQERRNISRLINL